MVSTLIIILKCNIILKYNSINKNLFINIFYIILICSIIFMVNAGVF